MKKIDILKNRTKYKFKPYIPDTMRGDVVSIKSIAASEHPEWILTRFYAEKTEETVDMFFIGRAPREGWFYIKVPLSIDLWKNEEFKTSGVIALVKETLVNFVAGQDDKD